jgi:thiamine biosynthesis lipoprotein
MGTRFEVVVLAGRGQLRAAGEAALDEIVRWHELLNRFAADSLLSHINRTAAARPVRLDGQTFALFETALDVWRASEGAFDVTVAPLMVRNGFSDSSVSAHAGRSGSSAIALDSNEWTIRFRRPGIALDLGGIGKGHALDCAAAILRDAGVQRALLHGGTSSAVAIGAPPNEPGWRVAIGSAPNRPVVVLRDEALSVSDPAGQASPTGAPHIVDPASGRGVENDGPVAVIGPSCAATDAWSTALVVLRDRLASSGAAEAHLPDGYRTAGNTAREKVIA